MTFILDSNIIISALIKDSKTREIIAKTDQKFLIPEIVIDEIRKYKGLIIEKSKMSEEDYTTVLKKLLSYIEVIPNEVTEQNLEKAIKIMADIDIKDVIFIAAALSYPDSKIWSDDKHFERQNEIKILKTKEMVLIFE